MRKCPMCGNLTLSFSCTRCTGMPLTVETDFLAKKTLPPAPPTPPAKKDQERRR